MNLFIRRIVVITVLFLFLIPFFLQAAEYRILAIRVDFPYEEPDHDTTSGRGVFDLRDYHTNTELQQQYIHPWDIPPHDRDYFTHHLNTLSQYWNVVSDGEIGISYEIWPQGQNNAYTMSNIFYKYGNGRTSEQTFEKLAGLVNEAVKVCKQTEGDDVDFSLFDTIMIIHAGIGSETSGALNDIPSASLDRNDFLTYLGSDIIIDGRTIEHAVVVPEMTSMNGNGGLNGILAQMFGFRLGLPSLSNNKDGLPAAGGWALMDIGAMAWGYRTIGFLPTHPSIWSKIELGIVEPLVVTSDTTLDIAATHINNVLPRGIRIPITSDEYLLIENRFSPTPHDSLPPGIVFSGGDSTGVWLTSDHQDGFIPGSGILVWHINDSLIAAGRDNNTLNDDPFRRGIDLLEADGRQDIGAIFSFGDNRSEYSIGHDDDTYKSNDTAIISPTTNPHTGSMWGGSSGVTIKVNSPPGEIMSVSISFAGRMSGFPVSIPEAKQITAADLNDDGVDELIVSTGNYTFLTVFSDGTVSNSISHMSHHPPIASQPNDTSGRIGLFKFNSSEIGIYTIDDGLLHAEYGGLYDYFGGYLFTDGPLLSLNTGNFFYPLQNSRIYIESDFNENIYAGVFDQPGETYRLSIPDSTRIVSTCAVDGYLACLNANNDLAYGYLDNTPASLTATQADTATGPLLLDIDRDDIYETVITADLDLRIYEPDGTYEYATLPDYPVGDPVAADIDADGYPEIIICTRNQVFAFRTDAAVVSGFPMDLPAGDYEESISSQPVIVDLDGDGSLDIAFATSNQRLVSFETNGLLTPGFPIALPGIVTVSPCVFRGDSSGNLAIACLTVDGTILAYNTGITYNENYYQWPMWKGGADLSGAFPNERIKALLKTSSTFEAFCYPNPVTGNRATFRIIPAAETDCTITLYTIDGHKVFETSLAAHELHPGVANDISFDSSDLASGLYIAKIVTAQQSLTYKVGVLK